MRETFGETITGADALSLSVKVDILNVKDFLKECYTKYESNEYQHEFAWIDQISDIKDPNIIKKLDGELVKKIKGRDNKTWMAVPEIIDWENVYEFKFKEKSFGDDIDLQDYLGFIGNEKIKKLTPEQLRRQISLF